MIDKEAMARMAADLGVTDLTKVQVKIAQHLQRNTDGSMTVRPGVVLDGMQPDLLEKIAQRTAEITAATLVEQSGAIAKIVKVRARIDHIRNTTAKGTKPGLLEFCDEIEKLMVDEPPQQEPASTQ